jgi:crotonobetainyl-CoA:carnitine CoA-transferase CaiB-like acyl-CoA transferase
MVEPRERGPGPLTGTRVLDLSRVLSGPHCGRILTDLGADVIKVEPPEGDLTRFSWPRVHSIATYFTQQNCGKRNVSVDLRHPEGVGLLRRLIGVCDVVLENFRPGVMDRIGLGYAALAPDHPRLIYCAITGYGQEGPWSTRRAYAAVVGAESGFTWLQGRARHDQFANDPMSHGDLYAALEAAIAIVAALHQRQRTGRGQMVDVSMTASLLSINEHVHWLLQGRTADGVVASFAPGDYPVLTTADGQRVVAAGHPADRGTFERFARGLGRPELVDDPRFGDVAARLARLPELIAELQLGAARIATPADLEARLAEEGLAVGVLRTVAEVAASEWASAAGAIADVPDRGGGVVRIPNAPWRFSDADAGVRGQPAYRGEHNREVFRELCGVADAELDRLAASGVLSSRVPG